jgi:hypothetical protein
MVSVKSDRYCTSRISAEKKHVGREAAVSHLRERVHDQHGAQRAGQARQRHRRQRATGPRRQERDREHGAERRSRRHAQRERRRQRVAQQRLHHHAGDGERGADQPRGEHAGQSGDEEDLRGGVVGPGARSIQHGAEIERRGADERGRDDGRDQQGGEHAVRAPGASPQGRGRLRGPARVERIPRCRRDGLAAAPCVGSILGREPTALAGGLALADGLLARRTHRRAPTSVTGTSDTVPSGCVIRSTCTP